METTNKINTHKTIKWLVLDFGNNSFIRNINFDNWVIKLKDNKEYFMVNFNVYDNLDYKTCYNDYVSYITSRLNISNSNNKNNILITTDSLTSYLRNKVFDLIYEDLIAKTNNNIDIIKLNVEKNKLIAIPVFENNSTLYVCIINFSSILSRMLNITINNVNIFDTTIYHLINVKSGINHYKEIKKVNGFSFNFMTSLWKRIENNNSLLLKEYKIGKFKFNLGNLIYSLNNKFPTFYVIFDSSSSAKLDKSKQTFITHFYPIKDKTKRAKKLNKLKNIQNLLVKDILDNEEIDLNIDFHKLSISDKDKKKMKKKCFTHMETEMDIDIDNKKKELHAVCKELTGSKHCYYSGYNDIIKSFDKFTLNLKNDYSLIQLDNDDLNDNDCNMNE